MDSDERPKDVLVSIARANDITLVAEPDHTDSAILAQVGKQWPAMAENNVRHLFLEHDPKEVSVATLMAEDSEYGKMIRNAVESGAQVHLYDDRSRLRERDERYSEESKFRYANDPYLTDQDGLIAGAADPQRMKAYLQEIRDNNDADLAYRNQRMADNIATAMEVSPGEKAIVMVGAAHTYGAQDLDEMLRQRGQQVATAEVNSPDTNNANLMRRNEAQDKPDFVVSGETGELMSYRDGENKLLTSRGKTDADIPWTNGEEVARSAGKDVSQSGYTDNLKEALAGVDLSWARSAPAATEQRSGEDREIGQLAAPTAPINYDKVAALELER